MLSRDNIDLNPRSPGSSLDPYPESSRVLTAIQKGYTPKLKYRSPAHMRTSSERRMYQVQRGPILLDICEVAAHTFNRLSHSKDSTMFSLTLQEIDRALGIQAPLRTSPPQSPPSHPPPSFKPLTLDPKLCPQEKDRQRALFRMEKELHLATSTTQEELELYRERKNVNPAIKLPKQYHNYLDVFSKKEVDTLPEYRAYNHAINLKGDA